MDGPSYTRGNEGLRLRSYRDNLKGVWTVGYGCTGRDPYRSPDLMIGPRTVWTQQQADEEFERRYEEAVRQAAVDLGPIVWACLDEVRRAALADAAFEMGGGDGLGDSDPTTGRGGLAGFHKALGAVADQAWQEASDALLDSPYARQQAPARAKRNAGMLRTGLWPDTF